MLCWGLTQTYRYTGSDSPHKQLCSTIGSVNISQDLSSPGKFTGTSEKEQPTYSEVSL